MVYWYVRDSWMALFFSGKCEMASFFSWIVVSLVVTAVNHDFFKIFFSEMRNKRLIRRRRDPYFHCFFLNFFFRLLSLHNREGNSLDPSTLLVFSRTQFSSPFATCGRKNWWRCRFQNLMNFLNPCGWQMSPFCVSRNIYFVFHELWKVDVFIFHYKPRLPPSKNAVKRGNF